MRLRGQTEPLSCIWDIALKTIHVSICESHFQLANVCAGVTMLKRLTIIHRLVCSCRAQSTVVDDAGSW